MRILRHPWFIACVRLMLGGIFLYAGILKMRDPQAFADSVASFQVMPKALINVLALGLPPFEIIVGGMLVVAWPLRVAALGAFALACIFALALGQALARGLTVDCGCFGGGTPSLWKTWTSLGRDLLLGAGAWILHRAAATDGVGGRLFHLTREESL